MKEFEPLDLFDEGSEQPTESKTASDDKEKSVPTPVEVENQEESATDESVTPEAPDPMESAAPVTTNTPETAPQNEDEQLLKQVIDATTQISQQLTVLSETFNTKLMHSAHEEKIVDQMHKELQKYKEDMYAQLVRPILLDVIEVRDSIMRIGAVYRAKPDGEQAIPNKTFSDYAYDLQDILEKNSVEIYRSKTGDDFTPIKQRVIKKVPTVDESLHGKVAEPLSWGYSYNGRTISAEKITVYYFEKPVEENENSEVIENG